MAQRSRADRVAKRALDIFAASLGLIISLPLFLTVSVAIKLDSGGPVFFRQQRVGRGGRTFDMWKFRTMIHSPSLLGPELTVRGDSRITTVGVVLRKSKVDELPQLFNVLVGSMSLVGPRPEVPRFVAVYSSDERAVLEYRPGITDPASIEFHDEERILAGVSDPEEYYRDTLMRRKIGINLKYAAEASVLTDMRVLFRTLLVVFRA
jgi:lipopolysaccharide/colanic/teichoic acid biosynthesis glycosyltransferase